MATLDFYATSNLAGVHQEMQDGNAGISGSATLLSPATGWIAGNATGNRSPLNSQVEQAMATFTGTTDPDGTPDTSNGDCFRSTRTYNGTFAAGNWNLRLWVKAVTSTGCSGRAYFRLLRGTNPTGSGATEITSGAVAGGILTSLTTTGDASATVTNIGSTVTLTDEFLFLQIAWERTGAGGMSTSDVNIYTSNGSYVLNTPDFTDTTPVRPTFVAAGAAQVASGSTAITPALPAGIQENDILLLVVQTSNQPVSWSDFGPEYVQIDDQTHMATGTAATAGSVRLSVFWRRATASESTPNFVGGSDHKISQILAFRNCPTSGNPWSDVATGVRTGTGATNHAWADFLTTAWLNGSSITPTYTFNSTVNESLVLIICAHAVDTATLQYAPNLTGNSLINFAELTDVATATGTGGGFGVGGGVKPTAGSVNAGSGFALSSSTSSLYGIMVLALKPAGPVMPELLADKGDFALTGNPVGLIWGQRSIVIPSGSYALTGQAVILAKGKAMSLAQGSYALTGQALNLLHKQVIALVRGLYALNGQAQNVLRGRIIQLGSGGGAFPSSGCTAYYKLDDLTEVVGGLTLTNNNSATFGTGKVGSAVTVAAASSQYLSRADNAAFQMGTGSFTIAAWVKTTSAASTKAVVYYGEVNNAGYGFTWIGYTIRFRIGEGFPYNTTYADVGTVLDDGNWHLVVGVCDRTAQTIKVYWDGSSNVSSTSSISSIGSVNNSAGFKIGAHHATATDFWDGSADEVAIYNRALTTGDIDALWNGGAGTTYSVGGAPTVYALTGQAVLLPRGKSMPLVQGAYALTGQAVTLLHKQIMAITQGAYSLGGQALNTLRGRKVVISQGAYALTGFAVTLSQISAKILTIVQGAFTLTGQAVNLFRGRKMPLVQGAYSLTGQTAGLLRGRLLGLLQGAYSLSGTVTNLLRGRKIPLVQGAYVLTGQLLGLRRTRLMPAAQATYNLTGQAVNLSRIKVWTMPLAQGAFTLTGQLLSFFRTRKMPVAQGSYLLSGQPVALRKARRIVAVQGAYSWVGQPLNLYVARRMSAAQGSYVLSGQPVGFVALRKMPVGLGSFTLTGRPVLFKAGRVLGLPNGVYNLSGFEVLFISSMGETWLFYAGQVAQSAVRASIAASVLGVSDADSLFSAKVLTGLSDGNYAALWPDSSGNGFDAAGVVTRRPVFKTNILNGKSVTQWDGSDDLLVTPNGATAGLTTAATIFIVQRTKVVQSSAAFMAWQTSPDQRIGIHLPWSDNNIYWDFGDAAGGSGRISVAWGGNTTDFFIWTFRAGGGIMEVWRNGTNIASVGSKITNFLASGIVPIQLGGASGIAYQNADMAEIIVFNAAVSDTNRAGMEKFLANYYGLTVAGGVAVDPSTIAGLHCRWKADLLAGSILNAITASTFVGTPAATSSAVKISVAGSDLKVQKTES